MYYIIASQILKLLQHGVGLYANPMEGQELLSSLSRGGRKKGGIVLQCICERDFSSLPTTIVSGIENIPVPACLVALMI